MKVGRGNVGWMCEASAGRAQGVSGRVSKLVLSKVLAPKVQDGDGVMSKPFQTSQSKAQEALPEALQEV